MVIAICTRILSGDEAAAKLLMSWAETLAAEMGTHQFYFISNKEIPPPVPGNVKNIVIRQQAGGPLLWKLWYNYKLPAVLKRIKADMLISADAVCSLRTRLPQCVIVNELDFLHHPEWYSKRYLGFMKKGMSLYLRKAAAVITFSAGTKKEIIKSFAIEEDKIAVISFDSNIKYQPLIWEEKRRIKDKYAGGNEYFLLKGAIHSRNNLTHLLKAFSVFKKRQRSSMQLVLVMDEVSGKDPFVESLRLYKYRNEVKLAEALAAEEIIALAASASCVISLSPLYSDIIFLQHALLCEVPVIAGDTALSNELLKDAALYVNPASIDSIAEQMMIIYKDEKKQNELVENGQRLFKRQPAAQAWEMIVAAADIR